MIPVHIHLYTSLYPGNAIEDKTRPSKHPSYRQNFPFQPCQLSSRFKVLNKGNYERQSHIIMLTLLLPTLYVLEPVTGCMAGVKIVPPASLVIEPWSRVPQSESSQACVPCRRGGPSGTQSSRFLWPVATTSAPCCPDTESSTNYLTNVTGERN